MTLSLLGLSVESLPPANVLRYVADRWLRLGRDAVPCTGARVRGGGTFVVRIDAHDKLGAVGAASARLAVGIQGVVRGDVGVGTLGAPAVTLSACARGQCRHSTTLITSLQLLKFYRSVSSIPRSESLIRLIAYGSSHKSNATYRGGSPSGCI